MTVQTTWAGGINPLAAHFKYIKPKSNLSWSDRFVIDTDKIEIVDELGKRIKLGNINQSSDFLDKMKPGYTLKCDPKDHARVMQMFCYWRKKQPGDLRSRKFKRLGEMGIHA